MFSWQELGVTLGEEGGPRIGLNPRVVAAGGECIIPGWRPEAGPRFSRVSKGNVSATAGLVKTEINDFGDLAFRANR